MTDLFQDNNADPVIDDTKDYLEELVGDDKKFKDIKSLARGKYEADLMIETMKRRQDELREDYLKLRDEHMASAKLQDLIDRLDTNTRQPQTPSDQPPANDVKMPDPKDLESMIEAKIQASKVQEKQDSNFNLVMGKLKEKFGTNYVNILREQSNSLGLTPEDVNALARKSPDAFFKTFGVNDQKQDLFQSPPNSSMRSDNSSLAPKKRSWSYYQDLKRKDPVAYHNPKTQVQMHNDAIALGEAFQDGDYHRSWSV